MINDPPVLLWIIIDANGKVIDAPYLDEDIAHAAAKVLSRRWALPAGALYESGQALPLRVVPYHHGKG